MVKMMITGWKMVVLEEIMASGGVGFSDLWICQREFKEGVLLPCGRDDGVGVQSSLQKAQVHLFICSSPSRCGLAVWRADL